MKIKKMLTEDQKEENVDQKEEIAAKEDGEKKDLLEQHKEKVGEVDNEEPKKESSDTNNFFKMFQKS